MHQISPKVPPSTCFLPKQLESIDIGASQQCFIFGWNVFFLNNYFERLNHVIFSRLISRMYFWLYLPFFWPFFLNIFLVFLLPETNKCVRLCVCLFTFEVPFNGLFAPISRSRMSNIFWDSESLGKSNGKKWSNIWIFLFGNGLKLPRKKSFFFFADFAGCNRLIPLICGL